MLLRVVITVRTLEDFAILRLESWREREVRALCSHGQQAERQAPRANRDRNEDAEPVATGDGLVRPVAPSRRCGSECVVCSDIVVWSCETLALVILRRIEV